MALAHPHRLVCERAEPHSIIGRAVGRELALEAESPQRELLQHLVEDRHLAAQPRYRPLPLRRALRRAELVLQLGDDEQRPPAERAL